MANLKLVASHEQKEKCSDRRWLLDRVVMALVGVQSHLNSSDSLLEVLSKKVKRSVVGFAV